MINNIKGGGTIRETGKQCKGLGYIGQGGTQPPGISLNYRVDLGWDP